jgi:hypothetical protein
MILVLNTCMQKHILTKPSSLIAIMLVISGDVFRSSTFAFDPTNIPVFTHFSKNTWLLV